MSRPHMLFFWLFFSLPAVWIVLVLRNARLGSLPGMCTLQDLIKALVVVGGIFQWTKITTSWLLCTGHQSKEKERLQEDEGAISLMGVAALYVSN